MIDFPASPVLDQTFTAPSGVMYKCTSAAPVVWTSMASQASVPEAPIDGHYYARKDAAWAEDPPFPEAPTDNLYYARRNVQWVAMTKAGAGLDQVDNTSDVNKPVSTAQANADALRVLKTGDTMTGPLLLPAGTVAAPALAWSAEPGLGVFRISANNIGWASAGVQVAGLDSNVVGVSALHLIPRAAGSAVFQAFNAQVSSGNYNFLQIGAEQTQFTIRGNNVGSATAKPLNFMGAANYNFDRNVTVSNAAGNPVFTINGGGGGPGTELSMNRPGGATGSNSIYGRIDGTVRWAIENADSLTNWSVSRFGTGGNFLNAPLSIRSSDSVISLNSTTVGANGGINANADIICGGGRFIAYASNISSKPAILQSVQIASNTAAQIVSIDGGASAGATFFNDGRAQNGQNISTWWTDSDRRLKDRIADYTDGLDVILALRPRTFHYLVGLTDIEHVGIVADEAEIVMPRLITRHSGVLPDGTEVPDLAGANTEPMVWALVNSVKELSAKLDAALARIAQLEAMP